MYVILFLFIVSLLLKFQWLVDHNASSDEATYLIIGRAIFNGKTYLVDLWDFKPIGIFLIFGFVQHYIFDSVLAVRLTGIIFITFTAWFIYKVKLLLGAEKKTALVAACLYPFLISLIRPVYNLNTEVFFNFFTILSFYMLVKNKGVISVLMSGLSMGAGFMIKYVVAFDALVIFLFYIAGFYHAKETKISAGNLKWSILAFFVFLIPFAGVNLYYHHINAYPEFIDATFRTSKVYADRISLKRELMYFADFNISVFPVILLFYRSIYINLKQKSKNKRTALFFLCWYLVTWVPVILQGKHFAHYLVQLFIPVCLFAVEGIENTRHKKMKLALAMLFLLFMSHAFFMQYKKVVKRDVNIEQITGYLKPQLEENDLIFTNIQGLYYHLNKIPPSKIIHHSIITDSSHISAAGIDAEKVIDRVFDLKPAFLIFNGEIHNITMKNKVEDHYHCIKNINGKVFVYKLLNLDK